MQNRSYGCGFGHPRASYHGYHSNKPPVNIEETATGYRLWIFAPSLQKENISVTTKNDLLSIRYSIKEATDTDRYTHKEYGGPMERSFDLKGKVDIDRIEAIYADGILKIELPKTDAAKRPEKEVPVQ